MGALQQQLEVADRLISRLRTQVDTVTGERDACRVRLLHLEEGGAAADLTAADIIRPEVRSDSAGA